MVTREAWDLAFEMFPVEMRVCTALISVCVLVLGVLIQAIVWAVME